MKVILKNQGPYTLIVSNVDAEGKATAVAEREPDGDKPGIELDIPEGGSVDIAVKVAT